MVVEFDDEGRVLAKGEYVDGLKEGLWEHYRECDTSGSKSSSLDCKGNYVHGLKHGYWEFYYRTGHPIKSKGNYVEGQKHGQWKEYFVTGTYFKKLSKKINYDHGVLHGTYKEYCPFTRDRLVLHKWQYVNGLRTGLWEERMIDGYLYKVHTFKNNVFHGPYKEYNGQRLMVEGQYSNDRKFGDWKYYTIHGQLHCVEHYEDGRVVSHTRYIYKGLRITRKDEYVNDVLVDSVSNGND